MLLLEGLRFLLLLEGLQFFLLLEGMRFFLLFMRADVLPLINVYIIHTYVMIYAYTYIIIYTHVHIYYDMYIYTHAATCFLRLSARDFSHRRQRPAGFLARLARLCARCHTQ